MDKEQFIRRLVELRVRKGVSARDMSLSLGQSPGYINNIENGINFPSMTVFFWICEYLGVSPRDFFDTEIKDPVKVKELCDVACKLTDEQLDLLIALAKELAK